MWKIGDKLVFIKPHEANNTQARRYLEEDLQEEENGAVWEVIYLGQYLVKIKHKKTTYPYNIRGCSWHLEDIARKIK